MCACALAALSAGLFVSSLSPRHNEEIEAASPIEGIPGYLMTACVSIACKNEVAMCSVDPQCRDAVSCFFDYAT